MDAGMIQFFSALKMTPIRHTGDRNFLSGGGRLRPPVLIQQDQHNMKMISKHQFVVAGHF